MPPPPPGTADTQWKQLSPPGWNPGLVLERLGVAKLLDSDPRAAEIMSEVQREWQQAPAIGAAPQTRIRLTGFPVLLDDAKGPVKRVLLAPYYGACIHTPPPPANQTVLVTLDREMPRSMYQHPVWITGKLAIRPSSTRYGRVVYQITGATWEPYPYQEIPPSAGPFT